MNDEWIRSSFCDAGSCVEVRFPSGNRVSPYVEVRQSDSDDIIQVDMWDWADFIAGVKAGEFDL